MPQEFRSARPRRPYGRRETYWVLSASEFEFIGGFLHHSFSSRTLNFSNIRDSQNGIRLLRDVGLRYIFHGAAVSIDPLRWLC